MKRFICVLFAWFLTACVVQTDTVEGKRGPEGVPGEAGPPGLQGDAGLPGMPGVSPFVQIGQDAIYNPGDVGIGTGTMVLPTARLHVVGAAAVPGTGSVSSNGKTVTGDGGSTQFTKELSVGDEIVVGNEGQIVASIAGDAALTVIAPFTMPANHSQFLVREPVARLVPEGGLPGMVVNSQGSVGIGTTTPNVTPLNRALTIRAESASHFARPGVELVGDQLTAGASIGSVAFFNATNGVPIHVAQVNAIANGNAKGASLEFLTTDSNANESRVTIDGSGRLGIGTTTPASRLHVATPSGEVRIQDNDSSATDTGLTAYVLFVDKDGTPVGSVGDGTDRKMVQLTADLGYGLEFATNGNDRQMVIDVNGRVGIGATNPQDRLHVGQGGAFRLDAAGPTGPRDFRFVVSGANSNFDTLFIQGEAAPDTDNFNPPAMAIHADGNVGIGTTNPAYKLDVAGCIRTAGNAVITGGVACSSDARLKQNIGPLPTALARLLRLRGVTYEWKDPIKHANLTGTQIGMIAQQVEEVFPEWVGTDPEGFKTLTYRGFEALTVESFRELDAKSTKLEAENHALTTKLASLEERLAAVEKRNGVQHASFIGNGQWPFALLLGGVLGAAPIWLRRRRNGAPTS